MDLAATTHLPNSSAPLACVHDPTPVIIRLADEGVPVSAIARAMQIPRRQVQDTIQQAIKTARLTQSPPPDWPPTQPKTARQGHPVHYDDNDLVCALQTHFRITRQQALLLAVMLKRPLATKEALHAAAQQVHDTHYETSQKLVDVLICKLRKRMPDHGPAIQNIWGAGYALPTNNRKAILQTIGLTIPDQPHEPVKQKQKR